MSLVRNFNNVVLDEMFFYEFSRCQYRASNFCSKNQVKKVHNLESGTFSNVRTKVYVPYGDSLKYSILKKIYFASSNILCSNEPLSLEKFKQLSVFIIEKEIAINKKKLDKGEKHYSKIKESIINELPKHFELINVFDFEDSIKNSYILKVDLKKYLNKIKSKLRSFMLTSIPELEQQGNPLLNLELLSINKKDFQSVDVVVVLMQKIDENFQHRNFIISILFNYFYYFMQEEFKEFFDVEKFNVNNVIVYNPLNMERHTISFEDIKGTLVEMDLFRILKVFIENLSSRTLNLENCKFCENSIFCTTRTSSRHKNAKRNILINKNSKKIQEMI